MPSSNDLATIADATDLTCSTVQGNPQANDDFQTNGKIDHTEQKQQSRERKGEWTRRTTADLTCRAEPGRSAWRQQGRPRSDRASNSGTPSDRLRSRRFRHRGRRGTSRDLAWPTRTGACGRDPWGRLPPPGRSQASSTSPPWRSISSSKPYQERD